MALWPTFLPIKTNYYHLLQQLRLQIALAEYANPTNMPTYLLHQCQLIVIHSTSTPNSKAFPSPCQEAPGNEHGTCYLYAKACRNIVFQ